AVDLVSNFLQLAFEGAANFDFSSCAHLAQIINALCGSDDFLRLGRFDLHPLQRFAKRRAGADGHLREYDGAVPDQRGALGRAAYCVRVLTAGRQPLMKDISQQRSAAKSDRTESPEEATSEQVVHPDQNSGAIWQAQTKSSRQILKSKRAELV